VVQPALDASTALGLAVGLVAVGVAVVPAARNAVVGLFNRGRAYFTAPTATAIATPSTMSTSSVSSVSSSSSSSSSAGKEKHRHKTTLATAGGSGSGNVRIKPPSLVEQARLAGMENGSQNWNQYLTKIKNDSQYKSGNAKFKDSIYDSYRAGALSVPDPTIPMSNINAGGYVPLVVKTAKPQLSAEELAEQQRLADEAFDKKVNSAKQRLVKLRGASEAVVSILLDRYGNEICTGRNGGIADERTPNAAKVLPVTFVKDPNHINGYGSACAEAHAIVKWSNSGKRPAAKYSLAYGPEGFKSACGTCEQALRLYGIVDLIDY
jgi:hypothetical protein